MAECIVRSYIRKMAMLEMAYTMETETDAAVVLRMIDDAPAADVAPIEALERLRDELCAQDLITMEGLRKLNTLIWKYTTVHDGGAVNG